MIAFKTTKLKESHFVLISIMTLSLLLANNAQAVSLYAGTSSPGMVYAYDGLSWTAISGDLGYAVLDLIEFDGDLYAATMSTSDPHNGVGKVWRYEGSTNWTVVGDNMDDQVCDLVEYEGDLYAGTAWNGGKLYCYDTSTETFGYVGAVGGWSGIRCMYSWSQTGELHLGDIGYDKFGRFDGTNFFHDIYLSGSCIYDFAEFNNALYGSAYLGRLWLSTDGTSWSGVLGYDYSVGNIWELEPFQGLLFVSYHNGELRSLDTSHTLTQVWQASDGIISMIADGDSLLYFGTGGEAGAYYGSEGSGTARVYTYDGVNSPVEIFDADGTETGDIDHAGIQCLHLAQVIEVAIDVKPTSCPNPVNVQSNGVLPVAIIGTEDLDVMMIDPLTINLIGVTPLRCSYEDVVTPYYPLMGKENELSCTEEGPDGYLDLTLKFDKQKVIEAIGEVNDGDVIVLTLMANLLPEHGGMQIIGEDIIIIRKKGRK